MKLRLGMNTILRVEKVQWWENTGCIINCKSSIFEPASAVKFLTSFLASFLRFPKDIANLAR